VTATPERIAPLARADIDAESRATLRTAFPRAAGLLTDAADAPPLPPILGLLARHPSLAGRWLAYNGALLDDGALEPRTRELLVLAVVRRADASYLWAEHVRIGRGAGITDDEIGALDRWDRGVAYAWTPLDAALLRAVDELLDHYAVADATWATLAAHFDERALLELLFVVGTYACLAMVLNGAGLASPAAEQR
jgi:alkylhydroperoxidase family enzyme